MRGNLSWLLALIPKWSLVTCDFLGICTESRSFAIRSYSETLHVCFGNKEKPQKRSESIFFFHYQAILVKFTIFSSILLPTFLCIMFLSILFHLTIFFPDLSSFSFSLLYYIFSFICNRDNSISFSRITCTPIKYSNTLPSH